MQAIQKRSTQVDLLHGNIFSSMIKFAIPLLLSNIFQQLYNTMDTIIVGHTLGEESLAAIGAAAPVYDVLIGFSLGIGGGLSLVTARSFGTGDENLLKQSVAASIKIGIGIIVTMTTLGYLLMVPFMKVLNTPAEIFEEAYSYVSVIILFMGVMFAYNLCAGILRAIGDSVMPLVFLIIASFLNIGLDLFLIVVCKMGIQGAAVATILAQAISVVLGVIYILKCARMIIPSKEHFRFDASLYMEMITQGVSMGLMYCVVAGGTAILQMGINKLGYLVIAGHTAARKLFGFTMMPFVAMINALGSFVSQNYGAGQIGRIRKAMKYAYIYNAVVAACFTVILYVFAPFMVRLLSGSEEQIIIANGTYYLRVLGPALFVLGFVNETRTALQGIGSKMLPLFSSLIELVGKTLFVLLLVPKFQYGAVVFCEPVCWCFMAVFLLIAFWGNPKIRGGNE